MTPLPLSVPAREHVPTIDQAKEKPPYGGFPAPPLPGRRGHPLTRHNPCTGAELTPPLAALVDIPSVLPYTRARAPSECGPAEYSGGHHHDAPRPRTPRHPRPRSPPGTARCRRAVGESRPDGGV